MKIRIYQINSDRDDHRNSIIAVPYKPKSKEYER